MTREQLAGYIDISLLRPDATLRDMECLIRDAKRYPFASICIPPCYVRVARMIEGPTKIGTVVGFPFGYETAAVKVFEAREAADAGVDEIDMVMNISEFKSGEHNLVRDEISSVVSAVPGVLVKVIIETCYLTDAEKVNACELVIGGGAGYVKTSTGFGPGGATAEDVRLLAAAASGRIKVKASGGIRNLDDAVRMIDAGASRIGTSAGVRVMEEFSGHPGR